MHTNTEGSTPLPDAVSRRLRAILGDRGMVTERDRLVPYESDALATERGLPRAALFPRTEEELAAVLETLRGEGIPFVPRGSGTGLSGGAVARDAVLLCMNRMNRILEVDSRSRRALVEPGVITDEVSEAAAPHGLRYLPDPASATACTIGGNVAENAGGPHCLKHGVTTDHVTGLRLLLPDGRRLVLRRGEEEGLDLGALVVGSEGTLGVVSRIEVRLVPRPETVRTALGFFDEIADAGRAVTGILDAGVVPVAMELVDGATIRVVERSRFAAGLPTDVGAALLVESEGFPAEVRWEIDRAVSVLEDCGARAVRTAEEEEARTRLWHARKKAYGALGRLAPDIFVQDAAVPRSALPELLPKIEEVAERHGVRLVNFFHAGDGNVHPNLVFDRRDPEQVAKVEAAGAEIMELCVSAGGTITGEHGVGLDKKGYMGLIYGPDELEAMRRLKDAFDPAGLCNPGKVLPDDGERSVGDGTSPGSDFRVSGPRDPDAHRSSTREPVPDIRHRREDLILTAPGDAALSEVMAAAGDGGQWLPPAAGWGRLTADEFVARSPAGPYQSAYGGPGRHLLEALVAAPNGRRYRWGRKVVKNVAGYDLPRLLCGHGGRLGRVLEATFRLWPAPEIRRTARLAPGLRAVEALAGAEPGEDVRPDGALWTCDGGPEGALRLELSGSPAGVEERARRLEGWARERGLEVTVEDGGELAGEAGPEGAGAVVLRASPGDPYLAGAIRRIRDERADGAGGGISLRAFPGAGALTVSLPDGGGGEDSVARLLERLPDAPWRMDAGPEAVRTELEDRREPEVRALEQEIVGALGGEGGADTT